MKRKHYIAIFAVLVLIISALTAVGVSSEDTEPPKISYGEEVIHLVGADLSRLLEDVQAWDNKDGDVTASVIVSRLYPVSDNTGVVIYAAKDAANNVVMKQRSFTYEKADEEAIFTSTGILQVTTKPDESDSKNDGNGAETNGNSAGNNGSGLESDGNGSESNGNSSEPNGSGQTGSNEPADDLNGSLTDEAYARLKVENQAKGYPFVRLKVHEVTLHVGDRFSIYTYIGEVGDDVDTINTMLRLEHNVDTSTPGVYRAEVYAKDSDGHVSNKEWLKVTVEGE